MKKDTKQFIIKNAADLFARNGYDGTSISDVMAKTGLKKGGIYNHFKNKEELALEAFDFAASLVFKRFRKSLDKCRSNGQKLTTIIDVFTSFEKDPVIGVGCPIFNMAVDCRDSHPALNDRSKEMLLMLKRYIEIKIEKGIEDKEFTTRITPSEIALLIMVSLEGAMIYSRSNIGENALEVVSNNIKDILWNHLIVKIE